jgi:hypothetical protein
MDISGNTAIQQTAQSQSHELTVLKKSIDADKEAASQLIESLPKIDGDAPKGQQLKNIVA